MSEHCSNECDFIFSKLQHYEKKMNCIYTHTMREPVPRRTDCVGNKWFKTHTNTGRKVNDAACSVTNTIQQQWHRAASTLQAIWISLPFYTTSRSFHRHFSQFVLVLNNQTNTSIKKKQNNHNQRWRCLPFDPNVPWIKGEKVHQRKKKK